MKKILGIGLISAILLASSPISYAENISANEVSQSSSITLSDEVKSLDESIIIPFDVQLIKAFRYTSDNAYENSFTLSPGNGSDANIWLQNLGTSTVYMKIFKNNVLQIEVPFNVGVQKTVNIYNTATSDYRIYVYNSAGAINDFNISAREF